uniref:NADAR domain-containing protein n=1 Tax=Alexandrium catenella TaxID=2925 RepID=A0A7S1QIY4_ALECA
MATVVVQMITCDRVGGQTLPVDVATPLTASSIVAAAAKKFKSVNKQSRVYHGLTGTELNGDVHLEDLSGSCVVLGSKAGWKGAEKLASSHQSAQQRAAEAAAAGPASEEAAPLIQDTSATLLEAAREERCQGVVLFWKDTQDNGYLSNWAPSPFVVDGTRYNCAEQWIMASKARACGDAEVLGMIMQSTSPRKQKGLGRSLSASTVHRVWTLQAKWRTQLLGARAKFQQNEALAVRLLRTGQKPIAEASPSDRIFGIGLAPSDPSAQDPANWRGENLLGRALAQVREELRSLVLSQPPGFEGDLGSLLEGVGPGAFAEVRLEAEREAQAADAGSDLSAEEELEAEGSDPEMVSDGA